jgi:zinc transporter ZupT
MIRKRMLAKRLWRNALWVLVVITLALAVGMVGYHGLANKDMDWVTAFANAAMILSGMGPLEPEAMNSFGGKLFEGLYALVSGLLFFAVAGFALAPALHHILRSFHLEDEDAKKLH